MAKVSAVILTRNEELHIERCIKSLGGVATSVLVVDSFSTDHTVQIARACGAKVVQRQWINYSEQFNWAVKQLPKDDTAWVLRIDADEYLTDALVQEIRCRLDSVPENVHGVVLSREMRFLGGEIRYGGLFPIRVLRLFRNGSGACENRWMDEHIIISGQTVQFRHSIIDDNLNPLSWWIDKHNNYASREAVDLLNLEFGFLEGNTVGRFKGGGQAGFKRWLKEVVYFRLPRGVRPLMYFGYRYILRLGFLDRGPGRSFHIMQGLWYRYLVDLKVSEVKHFMRSRNVDIVSAIREVLKIDPIFR